MKKKVLVIGGGASGMMAAIHAAREGAQVTILEHTDRMGKKILSTGNGKCNLTNLYQSPKCYRSQNEEFPMTVISKYPVSKTLDFFEKLGILVKSRDGYIYPNSEQASSVLDVLRMEVMRQNIELDCECKVQEIKCGSYFELKTSSGVYFGDRLILATGSRAAPVTGSDGSGYKLARKLGHTVIQPLPALVQLRCGEKHYKQLGGIRTEASLKLYVDGKEQDHQMGELQLTDYGISGIPTFQLSRYASTALYEKRKVRVVIDFLPRQTAFETQTFLKERTLSMGYKTAEEWITGMLNKKLASVLLKLADIPAGEQVSNIGEERMKRLLQQLKTYETTVIATNPYENAQICCGGVDTGEIDPGTMESKLVSGLFLVGELLDVDGICGGYNLQWAWSSGALAGIYAGRGHT